MAEVKLKKSDEYLFDTVKNVGIGLMVFGLNWHIAQGH